MGEEVLHIYEIGKKKDKTKKKNLYPVIRRTDIMSGILSTSLDKDTRSRLSSLYAEITYMEKRDLKYITEIAVSSQSEYEIYKILKKMYCKNSKQNEIARG